jgi:hypothetical protein
MKRVLDWIDRHAALFVIAGVLTLAFLSYRVYHDERATKASAAHTRLVQDQGAPVAVCLLDALRAVTPLLERVPLVDKPLEAYVQLQGHRYPGISCPEK